MKKESLIALDIFCSSHEVDVSFISTLEEYGLIETVKIRRTRYIPESRVHELEKLVRLHYDLDINVEGMEAILHLLKRMQMLQQEIISLQNKLDRFESGL